MLRALLYLRLTSLRNLVGSRLRRLRQPKYLAGALFAAGYFYFFVFRQARNGWRGPAGGSLISHLPPDTATLVLGLGGLALLVLVLGMWLLPSDRPGLHFTEAEIAFLFAAPITRRGLVHYKLISMLFASFFQTLFFAAIFNGRAVLTGRGGYILVGWWLVLSFISLHYLGSSLTIVRLAERGVRAHARRWAVLAAVLLTAAAAIAGVASTLPSVRGADPATWVQAAFSGGVLRWLLWPLQLLLRPFFAADLGEFALALGPALALLGLHYVWVSRTNAAFEEASIVGAERRAARRAELQRTGGWRMHAPRTGGRRPPFNLHRTPAPEFAFLWKNLLSTRPWFQPRVWLVAAGLLIALSVALQRILGPDYWRAGAGFATLGLITIGATLFYGPLLSRLDLRQDLVNADILKAYPLPGWRVVLGELLAPMLVLSGVVWLGLLAWYLGLQGHHPPNLPADWFSPGMLLVWGGCAAVLAPFLLGVELLIPNAAPVLLPGWFQTMRTPGGGIDLMGQRLIFGLGQILVVLLALSVAFGFAGMFHLMVRGAYALAAVAGQMEATGPGPVGTVLLWTVTTLLVLGAELVLGVLWIGRRFERLDVSEVRA